MIATIHDLTAWQIANLPSIDPARLFVEDSAGGLRLQANVGHRHFCSLMRESDGYTVVAMELQSRASAMEYLIQALSDSDLTPLEKE